MNKVTINQSINQSINQPTNQKEMEFSLQTAAVTSTTDVNTSDSQSKHSCVTSEQRLLFSSLVEPHSLMSHQTEINIGKSTEWSPIRSVIIYE